MIKLNLQGGETLEFDLTNEESSVQWDEWASNEEFQKTITGIGIMHDRKYHTLSAPKGFKKVSFNAELVWRQKKGGRKLLGEKISCHIGGIIVELLVYTYTNPPPPVATNYSVKKVVWQQRGPSFKDMKGNKNGNRNN